MTDSIIPNQKTMLKTIVTARAKVATRGYLTAEVQGGCPDSSCPAMEIEMTINEFDSKVRKAPRCPLCGKPLEIHWLSITPDNG